MRLRQYTILIFLCLVFAGCDALYRVLDREGAEEKELVGEVMPFEKNPTVEEIQSLLKFYGYNPGPVDGVLGFSTRNAIERFQKDHGLEPTRFADQNTWNKLKQFKDSGFFVEGQLNVRLVQEALEEAGFRPGKIDGKWGPRTKDAVKKFQKKHGLAIDGKIGYQTLSRLIQILPERER